jgi:hypothetical protein
MKNFERSSDSESLRKNVFEDRPRPTSLYDQPPKNLKEAFTTSESTDNIEEVLMLCQILLQAGITDLGF